MIRRRISKRELPTILIIFGVFGLLVVFIIKYYGLFNNTVISGYVIDQSTGKPIVDASIFYKFYKDKFIGAYVAGSTLTDNMGRFQFEVASYKYQYFSCDAILEGYYGEGFKSSIVRRVQVDYKERRIGFLRDFSNDKFLIGELELYTTNIVSIRKPFEHYCIIGLGKER